MVHVQSSSLNSSAVFEVAFLDDVDAAGESTQGAHRLVHGPDHLRGDGHVRHDGERRPAARLDLGHDAAGPILVDVDARHRGTRLPQHERAAPTVAGALGEAAGSRDQRTLLLQVQLDHPRPLPDGRRGHPDLR
jgi:hypothetical protein